MIFLLRCQSRKFINQKLQYDGYVSDTPANRDQSCKCRYASIKALGELSSEMLFDSKKHKVKITYIEGLVSPMDETPLVERQLLTSLVKDC